MVWLKSATQKEWVINGKVIPRFSTPDNSYLRVSDSDYNAMVSKPVFKSLVLSNSVIVLQKEPSELKNNIPSLKSSNAQLVAQNAALQAELEKLKKSSSVDVEAIKAEAQEAIKAEAVKELQEKQDALDAASAEIEKLKKQLAKAKGKSEE